jgi:acyl-CoA thioesterase FadM
VEIRTRAKKLSPVRLQFDYEAIRRADGAMLATGHTVHATIDRQGRPMRMPDRVKDLFA